MGGWRVWWSAMAVLIGCGSGAHVQDARGVDGKAISDSAIDAGRSSCVSNPFGPQVTVYGIQSGAAAGTSPWFADDELTAYFSSQAGGTPHVYSATRTLLTADFTNPALFGAATAGGNQEWRVVFTPDALVMVLDRNLDLYISSRASVADAWPSPVKIPTASSTDPETAPWISGDGLEVYFSSINTSGTYDLFKITRTSGAASFGIREPVAGISGSSSNAQTAPVVSRDGLEIFFGRQGVSPNVLAYDVWHATRASKSDPFGAASSLFGETSDGNDIPFWVSPDGCQLLWGDYSGATVITSRPP